MYRLFSSKHGILKALLDVSIVGDDEDVPMADRPQVRSLAHGSDPRQQIAGFVGITAQVNARVAPMYRILVSAAGTDPDAAALLDELTRQRQHGQRVIARSLARAGALRTELRERDAADVIHTLMSPEMYRLLVVDRGWKADRYERWLTEGPRPATPLAVVAAARFLSRAQLSPTNMRTAASTAHNPSRVTVHATRLEGCSPDLTRCLDNCTCEIRLRERRIEPKAQCAVDEVEYLAATW